MRKRVLALLSALLALCLAPAALAEGERIAIICGALEGNAFLSQAVEKAEGLKDVFGYELSVLECADEPSWARSYLSAMDAGCELVIGIGRPAASHAAALAGERREGVAFAVIDADAGSEDVASYTYSEEQSAYVLGVMAAEAFPAAERFGYIGAFEDGNSIPSRWGFAEGVRSVLPEAGVVEAFTGGESDDARAHDLALELREQGCPFVFGGAGAANEGIFQAALELAGGDTPLYTCGQGGDATRAENPFILSSQLKNAGVTMAFIIDNFYAGTLAPGLTQLDMASGTIGVAHVTSDGAWRNEEVLTDGVIGICQAVAARIADGELALQPPRPAQD